MKTNHETQKFTTIENLESKLLSLSVGVNAAISPVKVGGSIGGESATDEKTSKQNEENSSKKDVMEVIQNDNTLYNKLEKIKSSITLTCNVKKWKSTDFWKSEDFEFQGKKLNITISKVNDNVIYPRINYLEEGNMVIKYWYFTKDCDNGYFIDKIYGGGPIPDSFTYSFYIIKPDENDIGSLIIK
ncbi:hypothetical protein ACTFIY_001845 [Dictyostelium cf. discoideum]